MPNTSTTPAFVEVLGGVLHVRVLESGRLAAETIPPPPHGHADDLDGLDARGAGRAAEPLVIGDHRDSVWLCVDPADWCQPEHVVAQARGWAVTGFGILVRRGEKAELVPAPELVCEHVRGEVFPLLARWLARHGRAPLLADVVEARQRRLGRLEAEVVMLRAELAELRVRLAEEASRGRTAAS